MLMVIFGSVKFHSLNSYHKPMRSCQIQISESFMTKVANKPSRREVWEEGTHHLPWTFSTCFLVVEGECRKKGKVSHMFIAYQVVVGFSFVYLVIIFYTLMLYNLHVIFLPCLGKNVVHELAVTLEELHNGSTRKLGLQKNVICEKCDGKSNVTEMLLVIHWEYTHH